MARWYLEQPTGVKRWRKKAEDRSEMGYLSEGGIGHMPMKKKRIIIIIIIIIISRSSQSVSLHPFSVFIHSCNTNATASLK